jgi:hypothetical protein
LDFAVDRFLLVSLDSTREPRVGWDAPGQHGTPRSVFNYQLIHRPLQLNSLLSLPAAEFPFIAYYTINTTQTDPSTFYSNVRGASLSKFDAKNTRYTAAHTLDIYSEVASICRPPLMLAPSEQANVKKTPTTAYIISVYKVRLRHFRGKHRPEPFLWLLSRSPAKC